MYPASALHATSSPFQHNIYRDLRSHSQLDDRPLAVALDPTPPRLPPVAHVDATPGEQEIARNPIVLVRGGHEAPAVECVGEVDPRGGRGGRRGESGAVYAEAGLAARGRS